jgi:predicted hotdog family 3-hydroxylacyl-ACP dehydratase
VLDRSQIAALIPHQGAMCLLDRVESWSDTTIQCSTRSHLDPANPLRLRGRLSTIGAMEYAFQAAAAHGALRSGTPQPPGRIVVLRDVTVHRRYIDDTATGMLLVGADLEFGDQAGMIYRFLLRTADGSRLVAGKVTIALPQGLATGLAAGSAT